MEKKMAGNENTGVTIHIPDRADSGYTLFAEDYEAAGDLASGKSKIRLIDMTGREVRRWVVDTALQSHCRLLPNGNVIYPTRDRSDIEQAGLREIDADGNIVWQYHCRVDHEFQILTSGNLLIHTIADHPWAELGPELKRHPHIIEITRAKELVWQWRGEEHLAELEALLSPEGWRHFQTRVRGEFRFDWAHNNTCQIIPPNESHRQEVADDKPLRFKPGNLIFSYRSVDVIGVIDRESGEIVWAWGPGVLDGQHKPQMLPNGNILIFDNGTLRGYSRVIELNPLTETIEWEYKTDPAGDFFSPYICGAQRLPNGNTLICDGGSTRLFEVTGSGEIVWEFRYPWHEEGGLKTIYRCLRYDEEFVAPFL